MENRLPMALLASILRRTVNTALRYDPGSRHRLAKLSGKVIQLTSTTPPATLFICPTQDGVDFREDYQDAPDTILKGMLSDLLGLLANKGHTLANTDVEVSGDPALLRQIREIAQEIDIDWEEPLNALVGTVPGHQVAQLLRGALSWANSARLKTNQHLFEYLTEELRVIPSEPELKNFYSEVDSLRSDAERLQARINLLNSSLKSEQE